MNTEHIFLPFNQLDQGFSEVQAFRRCPELRKVREATGRATVVDVQVDEVVGVLSVA